MWVYTDEFTFLFYICYYIVDRNFCSSTGCCRNGNDRNARFLCRSYTFQLLTSSNSGFAMMIPIALEVSIEDPPPIAMM